MLQPTAARISATIVTAAVFAGLAIVLVARPIGGTALRDIDDTAQAVAAVWAATCCLVRARRSLDRRIRLSWILLGAAAASWAGGQLIWCWYELVRGRHTPFPSLADLGFLLFPLLSMAGLLVRRSAAFAGSGRLRTVLDAAMVAASLFNVSWATSLGQVYRTGGHTWLATVVSLAYPASDVMLLTVAVVVVTRSRNRPGLVMLCGALCFMSVADSAFAYLTATGQYSTGSLIDLLWIAAFLWIGLAAVMADDGGERSTPRSADRSALRVSSPIWLVLPYVLVVIGGIAVALGRGRDGDRVALVVEAIAVAALLIRQLLTVLDNRALYLNIDAQQGELRYRAFHDSLTGLANRALFYDRVGHALDLHRRDLRPVTVLFCDLDDFKVVNDTLGHPVGDALLQAVGERLRATARTGDTLARLGGDEFGVLFEDGVDAERQAARIVEAFTIPVRVAERDIPVRASVGLATIDSIDAPVDRDELIRRADIAMYAAKRSGRSVVSYRAELDTGIEHDLTMQLTLVDDVAAGRVQAALQPIFSGDGTVFGYEALARWTYRGEAVPPSVFIGAAERRGVLPTLDLMVIRQALERMPASAADGDPERAPLLTVNIGLSHLTEPTLPGRLARLVAEHGFAPSRLVVEVPEDRAIDDPRLPATLVALRRIGFQIAIDDFGVGYSSLSRIALLKPDIIKLDRSFVEPIEDSIAALDTVAGILELAHKLGATVIAEGVETRGQLLALQNLGCDAIQGFLLGPPYIPPLPAPTTRAKLELAGGPTDPTG